VRGGCFARRQQPERVALAQVDLVQATLAYEVLARAFDNQRVRRVLPRQTQVGGEVAGEVGDQSMATCADHHVTATRAPGHGGDGYVEHVIGPRKSSVARDAATDTVKPMVERASLVELAQIDEVLRPPFALGPYVLTSALARSTTALLFTATGGPFAADEGVLKLTSSHHLGRLRAELERLVRCADAGVTGMVQPLSREPDWLPMPGLLDAHVATLALPFFSGGDLSTLRRSRPDARAADIALTVASTLRHMLELDEPLTHGSLSMRSVMLPRPGASLTELSLIDLGSARDLNACSPRDAARACAADVQAFGAILSEFAPLRGLAADCQNGQFSSMADPRLWGALRRLGGKHGGLWSRLPSW
jgi:hypothetical protein